MKLILLLLLSTTVFAAECPLGRSEDHLTFARVMRNFGRFTLDAQSVAEKGTNPLEVVADEEITLAITKLSIAIDCNTIIIEDQATGLLLPDKASDLTGLEKEDYLKNFYQYLEDFKLALIDFQNELDSLLKTESSARNFAPLKVKSDLIDKIADDAHKYLE